VWAACANQNVWDFSEALRIGLYSRRNFLPALRAADHKHGHDALSSLIGPVRAGQRIKLGEANFRSKLITPETFSLRHRRIAGDIVHVSYMPAPEKEIPKINVFMVERISKINVFC
jgi:hypothetical protein